MKILLTISMTILGLSASCLASAATCDHKIILLPQLLTKRAPMQTGPIALSQFMIARRLEGFQGVAVFTENIQDDMRGENFRSAKRSTLEKMRYDKYKTAFPNGLPSSFDQLNGQQKEVLVQEGGDMIALMSGQVPMLYSATLGLESKDALDREKHALSEVNAYFSITNGAKNVILIVGADLDLSRHSDQFDPECIVTPADMKDISIRDSLQD